MSFIISDVMAAASAGTASNTGDSPFSLVMVAAIFVLFYFMLIRPQNKRAKDHKELINKLKKGDEIVTSGGLLGKVVSVEDLFIKISIAEGIEVNVQRSSVSSVLPKGTLKTI